MQLKYIIGYQQNEVQINEKYTSLVSYLKSIPLEDIQDAFNPYKLKRKMDEVL